MQAILFSGVRTYSYNDTIEYECFLRKRKRYMYTNTLMFY